MTSYFFEDALIRRCEHEFYKEYLDLKTGFIKWDKFRLFYDTILQELLTQRGNRKL